MFVRGSHQLIGNKTKALHAQMLEALKMRAWMQEMDDGFQDLNGGDALLDGTVLSREVKSKRASRKAPKLRKRRRRRIEAIDAEPLSMGGIMRRQRLILAAVRVWELKRGLPQ